MDGLIALIKCRKLRGQTILKVSGEGCQGIGEFQWIGKVISYNYNKEEKCWEINIEIMKHNNSYTDSRDQKKPELYSYPIVNNDIQNVKGVWILFT